jgi:group I intron endonuclease
MFIYLIVNHVTGKYYVGQHKGNNLKRYLQQKFHEAEHRLKLRSRLYASMRKHGRDAFSIHALLSDVQTRAELDAHERNFIAFLKSQDPEYGYNICHGGEGFTGTHTPEAKAKVTAALKQRWAQPGFKEHWNELMSGHPTSPETIEKIKAARAVQDETSRIEGCRRYAEKNPEEMSTRMSREVHVLGGRAGSRKDKQRAGRVAAKSLPKAIHTRWHLNRGVTSPTCQLCVPSVGNAQ